MEALLKDNNISDYASLDISSLKAKRSSISMDEALSDVVPVDWPDNVLSGKVNVLLDLPEENS